MSEHVNGTYRDQTILFPDTLDKYVDKENPVRFIDAFINSLNLEKLGFKHSITCETGRPCGSAQALCIRLPKPSQVK